MTQWTPNQVVAYNLYLARTLKGWTQDEAAEHLEPYLGERWSRVVFSAAERSLVGRRIKQFSADDLAAFAAVFELPVGFFFRPPRLSPNDLVRFSINPVDEVAAPGATNALTLEQLDDLARHPDDDERVIALVAEAKDRALSSIRRLLGEDDEGKDQP